MASLNSCMNKAGDLITDEDREIIKAAAAKHRSDGDSPAEAAVKAIRDRITSLDSMIAGTSEADIVSKQQKDTVQAGVRDAIIKDGGVLYSNPLGKIFSMAAGDTEAWAKTMRDNVELINKLKPERSPDAGTKLRKNWIQAIFDSSSAEVRTHVKKTGSQTAKWLVDQFHRETGTGKYTDETYETSVETWVTARLTRLDRALKGLSDAELLQAQRMVTSGHINNTKVGKAAQVIRDLNSEAFDYLKESGVELGEIKRGYLHRKLDPVQVAKVDKDTFVADATKAFRRANNNLATAKQLAEDLYNKVLFGDETTIADLSGKATKDAFMKGRVFGREVDNPSHPMYKYFNHNIFDVMSGYLSAVGKRSEIAKRFGDNFSQWGEIEQKIKDEGGAGILEELKEYTLMATGNRAGNKHVQQFSSALRTWGSLMFLSKATMSSIPEFIVPAMRTGNALDVAKSLHATIADLFNASHSAKQRREFAEDLGLVAAHMSDNMMVERWAGGDPVSAVETKILTDFFRRTGLTQWTAGTVVASTELGKVLIRRLSKQSGKLSDESLMELGVPQDKLSAFRGYVNTQGDGFPSVKELSKTEEGQLYMKVIRNFSYESVMRPSKTLRPKWMGHPIGAILGQLQSFNYAFYENVLKRNVRNAHRALTDSEYSTMERARLMMPTLMMPMLWAVAAGVGEIRDELLGDPNRRKEETMRDKALKAFSRGTPIAPIDPIMNVITQARYDASMLKLMAGPVIGTAAEGADAMVNAAFRDNPNTNTQERKAAKVVWDLFVEPTVNIALGFAPVSLLSAAGTQAVASGTVREKFQQSVAGKYKGRGGNKYQKNYGSKYTKNYQTRY